VTVPSPPNARLSATKLQLLAQLAAEAGLRPGTAAGISRRPASESAPLSFAQQRLWLHDQILGPSPAYNVAAAVRFRGELNVAALRAALAGVLRRHEALRTRFVVADGQPAQVVDRDPDVPLPVHNLSGLAPAEAERRSDELASAQARQAFDLARGPALSTELHVLSGHHCRLIVVLHHIVADGWSVGVLLREVAVRYQAELRGEPADLPPLPVQYPDFAVWQRAQVAAGKFTDDLRYWERRLAGAPDRTDLPADRPGGRQRAPAGHRLTWVATAELVGGLRQLGQAENCTLFTVLLAGLTALLHRYTGQSDIVIGAPVASRDRSELDELVGCFINILPIRLSVDSRASFRSLLHSAREATLDALARQDVPFDLIVERARPARRGSATTPLCNVALSLQNDMGAGFDVPGLEIQIDPLGTDTARFDLSIQLDETAEELTGIVEFSAALFDPPTIEGLISSYTALLAAAVAAPDTAVAELEIMTELQRRLLRDTGPAADFLDPAAPATLADLFAAQAAMTPAAIAVACGGDQLTYGELNRRANQLARELQDRGAAGPDQPVAILAEPSLALVVGILGILESGSPYLALDPSHPRVRLAAIIAESGARALVTDGPLDDGIIDPPGGTLRLDRDWDAVAAGPDDNPPTRVLPHNLAYLIYTSGSSGAPKGVQVTHANMIRLLAATRRHFRFTGHDTWTLTHSAAFDFSCWEMWGAWSTGARLLIVPSCQRRSPGSLLDLLATEGVTVLSQTPSAFRQIVDEHKRRPRRNLALRYVVLGGEKLEPGILGPWRATQGANQPRIVNMYGITETTVHASYHEVTSADIDGTASIVGQPLADLRLHVLDQRMCSVPAGAAGEIYVGGAGLARGYLGHPGLTASRFLPDPQGAVPGARLYRTGDLARRRTDGDLEYLGRLDEQVKIRGHRVELGEIDAALGAHPAVRQAAAAYRPDANGRDRLVGYLVVSRSPDEAEILALLRSRLPGYMVPDSLVVVDTLPVTANGKLDRRALPSPGPRTPSRAYLPPEGAIEQALAQIWADLLGVEQVSRLDNFFEIGGHSLSAVQLTDRVRDELQVEISVSVVLESATLAEMAHEVALAEASPATASPPIIALPRGGVSQAEAADLSDELSAADLASFLDSQ
jgi:amino acid adenylation domain-containing protein